MLLKTPAPVPNDAKPQPSAKLRSTKLTYRPDVDGLRAIAVLLVVFDHLHTRVRGGYIGVDIFFVISGYLISATILEQMAAGRFSLAGFYERRIRRIFPALLAMLLLTSLLAFRYFVPSEIDDFAHSLLAALFSGSNFLFWHQAGYFAAPSALKPLLHTWSLAVEEQFYIFFPVFLLAVRRWWPQRLKMAIWTIAGFSFALACLWVRRDATADFFFAPLRAWELLLGAILSQKYLPQIHGSLQRNLAALASLLLILVPALRYTAQTPFPGLAALPPCLGAALLIAAGENGSSLVGRALSWRPVVFIGLISYSLYLWHWPILVFQKSSYFLIDDPPDSKPVKVVVFLASLVAATLSWRFVETPFRKGRLRPGRRALLLVNGAAFALILSIGGAMIASHGFSGRFPAQALSVDQYTHYKPAADFRENVCFIGPDSTFADFNKSLCLATDPGGGPVRPPFLLLGDSHAAHLYPGLHTVFPEINFSQANTASCRPFLMQMSQPGDCGSLYRYIYGDYLPHHHPAAVLLAGRWDETEFGALGETVTWLQQHGQRVILFGPAIEFDVPLPRLLALSLQNHDPASIDRHRYKAAEVTDRKLAKLARRTWHVEYISAYEDLCASQVEMVAKAQPESVSNCPLYAAPGVPLLFDTDHFTPQGSILYARAIRNRGQLR